jgi:hypothetical protein
MGCRPIVSNINAPTEGLSKWLTVKLRKYAQSCHSFVKDSMDAMAKIRNTLVQNSDELYTMDIESMYTNIPIESAVDAISWFLHRASDPLMDIIIDALRIIMYNTYFTFGDSCWKQTKGSIFVIPPVDKKKKDPEWDRL